MEKNKVSLKIAGSDYYILSEEQPAYMQELAQDIDSKITDILKSGNLSITQAAILAALEYADDAKKNKTAADNLRSQLKEYLEDAAKAKGERDFYKRELDKLTKKDDEPGTVTGKLW